MANYFIEREQAQARAEAKVLPDVLRAKRAKAFKAFDIFKTNVAYGIVEQDEETRANVVEWYEHCLDMRYPELVADALDNIPTCISRYMIG